MDLVLDFAREYLSELLSRFQTTGSIVLVVNGLIFLFAKPISTLISTSKENQETQIKRLQSLNLLLCLIYIIPLIFPLVAGKISKSTLVVLVAYMSGHVISLYVLKKFGREKEVEGEVVRYHTYQSEIFNLLLVNAVIVTAFLALINIWNMTDWLKATSVFGGLLIIAFSTKDVWAPENIQGLIMLYNGDMEPGTVVKIDELNLLAVVKKITLTQTVLIDFRQRHQILVPNSKLRNTKIQVLSNTSGRGLVTWVDFNLGYGLDSERVEAFLATVLEQAQASEKAINEGKGRINLIANGDHAVTWRLAYSVNNIYKLLSTHFVINRVAYDLSLKEGIGLNTPLTHDILATPEMHPPQQPVPIELVQSEVTQPELAKAEDASKAADQEESTPSEPDDLSDEVVVEIAQETEEEQAEPEKT